MLNLTDGALKNLSVLSAMVRSEVSVWIYDGGMEVVPCRGR